MMNTDTANSEKGRKPHNLYKELGFESLHLDNGRMGAKCDTCNHILKNTAISRLRTHRKRCFRKSSSIDSKEGEAISLSSDDSVRSENVMTHKCNREINSTAASTGITSDDETQEVPQEVVMEVEVNTSAPPPQSSYRVLDIVSTYILFN
ncbi:uncharacterized protein LOC126746848 [Anthonomus grandis grandis]|uniref:uncharacterized protein LOC126746848 n=1 Tax=Anthonomus grandis grandis TaxID=2921223 RepID=UPI0021655E30|nr:uncharacterized protein LOC126746848 [Anthonomus grandis grandis]